jgi:hypothetical protein
MNIDKLKRAMSEAKRFQDAAKAYIKRADNDKFAEYGCAESGAAKRASMDLTRALAEMRKP